MRVKVARGGMVKRVTPAFQLVKVVATPSNSKARATSPTDWEQSGQAGTNRAALARSFFAAATIAGMVSDIVLVTSGW